MTTGRPGAAHIGLPFDVQKEPGRRGRRLGADRARPLSRRARAARIPAAVERGGRALARRAQRPVIICGGGVVISGAEARAAGARPSARRAGRNHDQRPGQHRRRPSARASAWSAPTAARTPTREVVEQADLVVFVGCRAGSVTTERWRYPAPRRADRPHRRRSAGHRRQLPRPTSALVGDAQARARGARRASSERGSARRRTARPTAEPPWRRRKRRSSPRSARSPTRPSAPIQPERVVADAARRAAARRDRGRRPRHALPLLLGLLRVDAAGPALHHQPRARRARLFACPARRRRSSAGPQAKMRRR